MSLKRVAKFLNLVGSLYDLVMTSGIKHRTANQSPCHAAVDTAIGLSLGRKHVCSSFQVSIDEVPALLLSRELLVLYDSLKVFIIDYDFLVTFCELEIHIAPYETQFGIQADLVFI